MARITTPVVDLLPNQRNHMLPGIQAVVVDGVRVGTVAKNKYGIWIGNFDRTAFNADNPFAAAHMRYSVRPSSPRRRTKRDVVADIVAGRVGEYEAEIMAEIARRDAARKAAA